MCMSYNVIRRFFEICEVRGCSKRIPSYECSSCVSRHHRFLLFELITLAIFNEKSIICTYKLEDMVIYISYDFTCSEDTLLSFRTVNERCTPTKNILDTYFVDDPKVWRLLTTCYIYLFKNCFKDFFYFARYIFVVFTSK